MTRRRMLQVTAIGGLIAISAVGIVYRVNGGKKNSITTVEGPFTDYGYYTPEELNLKMDLGDFVIKRINFRDYVDGDVIHFLYTFGGQEIEKRRIHVTVSAYDEKDSEVVSNSWSFEDPRIEAKRPQEGVISQPLARSPEGTFRLTLPNGVRIDAIAKLKIYVTNI